VRGATEGINLIANTWGKKNISAGDEIVISHLEHHANIVPWQILAAEKGARLRIIPVNDQGELLLEEYKNLLNPRTKLVAFTHVSNALGTITPVQEIVSIARQHGITTLVDGSQGVSHMKVDVQAYGADFYVFSGHKLFAPTGIGAVYGRLEVLESLPPWQGGGNMIVDVTFEKTVYHPAPFRFEAGTGNIADAVGLGAAIDYLENLGMDQIGRYEHELLRYATEHLQQIPGLRFIGTAKNKASVLSFVLEGFSNDEIGQYLNQAGIAVRTGHHCAQPILRRFGVESTVRPSLAFYNTCEEVDALVSAVWKLKNGQNIGI
jgi:cysteine desulfurase/selenocysteine lyase